MWPWEHFVIAYVCYSAGMRAIGSRPTSDTAVFVLAFAAISPDLVDKPLAWQWNIFESSYSIGHSIFVVVPVSAVVLIVTSRIGRLESGFAFVVGVCLHLLGDLIPEMVRQGTFPLERLLWPLATPTSASSHGSLVDAVLHYGSGSLATLGETELGLYVALQIGMMAGAIALWIADGRPGWGVLSSGE